MKNIKLFKFIKLSLTAALLSYSITCSAVSASSFTGSPVPGGVAIVDLGPLSETRPQARYGSKNILVIQQDGHWKGVVGLSLKTLPGDYIVRYQDTANPGKDREVAIKVEPKMYPEQRIKMKQKNMCHPIKNSWPA